MKNLIVPLTLVQAFTLSLCPAFAANGELKFKFRQQNGLISTFIDPTYNIDGIDYPVAQESYESDFCQRMGFDQEHVEGKVIEKENSDAAIRNSNNNFVVIKTDFLIKTIFCSGTHDSPPSTHYKERISNPSEHSVTIVEPRFRFEEKDIFFHGAARADGLCKVYGLGNALRSTSQLVPESAEMTTPYWMYYDSEDMFDTYFGAAIWDAAGMSYHRVSSVTCAMRP